MAIKNRATKQLTGYYCLPTSSRYHPRERERSGAFLATQMAFVLAAIMPVDQGGYPPVVVLTADEGALDVNLGDEIATQHAEVRKNLPPRRVVGVVMPDGECFGDVPEKGVGLPHWEFIEATSEGGASVVAIRATQERLAENRKSREAAKEAARNAKKSAKAA